MGKCREALSLTGLSPDPAQRHAWGTPGPHCLDRSTRSTLQSQFSGKKLRTRMSSSSISSSSCSTSWAGDSGEGEGREEEMVCPLRFHRPSLDFPRLLTSGKARQAPGLVPAKVLSKLATGQEGLPAGRLRHTGCPLLTGTRHGQLRHPILTAALGVWRSILAHCRARGG